MTYKLFLDDLRAPPDATWVVARSVPSAIAYVETYGVPHSMSLDHDLGTHQDAPAFLNYLITRHMFMADFDPASIDMHVHSANPVGAENLRGLWQSYLNFLNHAN